eukprot:5026901-Pyramimonas_sp.AAC.1
MQDQARFVEAKTQQEIVVLEAQRAEQARMDREEMNAVIEDVRKKFEAERVPLAQAASRREQELMGQMSYQTTAAQRRAEEEIEDRIVETISSDRQAAVAANSQSVDAKTACAAVAAARIEGRPGQTMINRSSKTTLMLPGWKWPMHRL